MSDTSFTRWQGRTLEQMGNLINTLLVICTASVGFVLSYLLGNNSLDDSPKRLLLWGLGILLFTAILLLGLTINRLCDFRLTTRITVARVKKEKIDIKVLRKRSKRMGNRTWCLLYISISTTICGFVLIGIGFFKILL